MAKSKSKKKGGGAKPKPKAKKGGVKARPAEALKMISANDLTNLLRRCKALAKQGSEISGSLGEHIKSAAETKNLDRKAFSMVRSLERMSAMKLMTTLACFDYYRDVLKLDDLAAKQGELKIARQEAGEEEPGEPSQKRKGGKGKNGKTAEASAEPTDELPETEPPIPTDGEQPPADAAVH